MPPTKKVVLFIDERNFYKGARRAFFKKSDSHVYGQFNPLKLGQLICSRQPKGSQRTLHQVRIYTGLPDSHLEPRFHEAQMRRYDVWRGAGAIVVPRPLQYLNWPLERPKQKGVDVALAIDFIALAIDGAYEVGIIASTDTDLIPALQFVYNRYYPNRLPEVASWYSSSYHKRLALKGVNLWCNWLKKEDYDSIADFRNYSS